MESQIERIWYDPEVQILEEDANPEGEFPTIVNKQKKSWTVYLKEISGGGR